MDEQIREAFRTSGGVLNSLSYGLYQLNRRHFVYLSSLLTTGIISGCGPASSNQIVRTSSGEVRGQIRNSCYEFLGVPFAEAPFGPNRFRAPVKRKSWSGVFDASSYGQCCPQVKLDQSEVGDIGPDCLNLNIWTPDLGASNLPVLFWVHGGDHGTGSGSLPLYNGKRFSDEGAVLVTANRRLGAEGFLFLDELFGGEELGENFAILDLICALEWVHENIGSFGGDASNLTLFGHGEGGALIQAMTSAPASKGLFRRIIVQSSPQFACRRKSASKIARFVIDRLAIPRNDFEALQKVDPVALTNLYPEVQLEEGELDRPYRPVISESMPVHPADVEHAGLGHDHDLLIGSSAEEASIFARLSGLDQKSVFYRRADRIIRLAGTSWDALRKVYGEFNPSLTTGEIDLLIMGDCWFRVPALRIAEGHSIKSPGRTYVYHFNWDSNLLGATHGLDLMMFGNGNPLSEISGSAFSENISSLLRKMVVSFARFGKPNVADLDWQEFDSPTRWTAEISESSDLLVDPFNRQRILLGRVMTDSWQVLGL